MYNKCCVVNCESRRKDVNFYRFPSVEIGLQKWLECINCDYLRSLNMQELHKQFVCQKHFEKKFISCNKVRARLRMGAYPTLFSEEEILNGVTKSPHVVMPDHDYTMKRRHVDHTYCKMEVPAKRSRFESEEMEKSHSAALIWPQPTPIPKKLIINEDIEPGCSAALKKQQSKQSIKEPITNAKDISPIMSILSTPKSTRRRVIARKESLTPNCARLYKEFYKSRKQLQFSTRARRALKFSKEMSFEKLTAHMNPLAKKVLWMQIKQCTKKNKGRRFTDEEKLISLAIMKQSPKCYKFLHKIFILPSKHTLNKMIAELNVEAGINSRIFEAIKKEVDSWQENKKYCSVLFDEVALETALTYDKHKDIIDGFVELNETTNEFADHALVFMLRGAVYKWQQPLVFYFCKGATCGQILKSIIKSVVCAVLNSGLIPVALICDQGTAFQSALKSLQEDTKREQIKAGKTPDDAIMINNHNLNIIYDPPHLIKGLRNNFLSKNIKFDDNKIATWHDIVDVYNADCNNTEMRLLHKLNDEHVLPDKVKKMKVKNCVRVMSKTVAATLAYTAQFSHYANGKEVSPTIRNTSEIISFFDDLFDSTNGASLQGRKSKGKPLRQAVTENSKHHQFWDEAIRKLKKIRFINKTGKETIVPSLKNWITTLKSLKKIWNFFKNRGLKVIRPRYFNSDPIENFFGQVRAYNFRNNDPNCHVFKNTFKSLLITRFIKFHSDGYNCEEDSGDQLLKWKTLFDTKNSNYADINLYRSLESSNFPSTTNVPSESTRQERLAVHSRAYTAGWVIRKITKKINCKTCKRDLYDENKENDKNQKNSFIHHKEYNKEKPRLTYPAEYAVRAFGTINAQANMYLDKQAQKKNIMKTLKDHLISINLFDFLTCSAHSKLIAEHFVMLTLRIIIFNWCNSINKILKGSDISRLKSNKLSLMQEKAFVKYKTKLKNKKLNK